jgi:PAS domain S-box-containing protein
MHRHSIRYYGGMLLLASIYVATAKLGLAMDAVAGFATLVWPPTGIALFALVTYGRRYWPAIWIGAIVVNLWAAAPLPVAVGIGTGNALEAFVGAYLLEGFGFRSALRRLWDVLLLVVAGAVLNTLLSASIGVASLYAGRVIHAAQLARTFMAWWLGDMIGAVIVTPFLFAWCADRTISRRPGRLAEATTLSVLLLALSIGVFFGHPAFPQLLRWPFVLLPALLWSAVRFQQRGVTTATLIVAVVAIWGTAEHRSPFTASALNQSLMVLQIYLGMLSITFLALGAVIEERKASMAALARSRDDLDRLVEDRTAELSRANLALQRTTAFQEALLSAQSDLGEGVAVIDSESQRLSYVNDGLCALYGYTRDELMAAGNVSSLVAAARVTSGPTAPANGPQSDRYELSVLRKDGAHMDIEVAVKHTRANSHGTLISLVRDITERKQAADQLRRAHEELEQRVEERTSELLRTTQELESLIEASPVAIASIDRDRTVQIWNPAAERLFGWTKAETLGNPLPHVPSGEQNAFQELVQRVFSGGSVSATEVRRLRKDGTLIDLNLSAAPLRDAHGRVIGMMATLADITERKQAEVERTRLLQDLEEALRARDQFLAVASHELRTPLTSLRLQVDGLLRAAQLARLEALSPERLRVRASRLQGQAERLEILIDALLDVSRITAGRLVLDREDVDLLALVHDVVSRHEEQLAHAQCLVSVTAEGEPAIGCWDRLRLDQVITNFLTNACKYGAGKPIDIVVRSTKDQSELIVTDHGVGIPESDQGRIFERFERAASKTHISGWGLGLWISRQVTLAMGGTISVDSEVGVGSTFTVTLPKGRLHLEDTT